MQRLSRAVSCVQPLAQCAGARMSTLARYRACDTDKILLQGCEFHGYHGVLPEERTLGQKFRVDVEMTCGDLSAAGRSDDLRDSVDYAQAFQEVKSVVTGEARELVETVAEDISMRLFAVSSKVQKVRVRVTKPHVAIDGHLGALGVEIERERAPAWA
ncbi:unnamed protein product [Pedinophyceae sp. YPF-701]|nr:unnamed protein product [Pedinophyceae sp. YPF-701]